MNIALERCIFTDCYCEENIWKFIESNQHDLFSEHCEWDGYAVVISNDEMRVPFWNQNEENSLCLWDYHVIFLLQHKTQPSKVLVYDLSSILSKKKFPIPFAEYIRNSFLLSMYVTNQKTRMELLTLLSDTKFRIIPAKQYLTHFSSDRSHMVKIDPETNLQKWSAPPPNYPCIVQPNNCTKKEMNLPLLWNMNYSEYSEYLGTIVTFREFGERFQVEKKK